MSELSAMRSGHFGVNGPLEIQSTSIHVEDLSGKLEDYLSDNKMQEEVALQITVLGNMQTIFSIL